MPLFQKSVENKYLNELDSALIDKKYTEFQNYFGNSEIQENIRNIKEEAFQEGFLRESFVNILGYTLNPVPNYNLVLEKKNVDDTRKSDGAVLNEKGEVIAVIELKSTDTTDLDTVETQAFGYKHHQPECIYVITSNFEKLRFYIQNAVDYIEFDLFNLTKENFSLMWLCLFKDNLLNGLPLKIKESSVLQEENVTKKLYVDYSKFREAIYNNLVKNNPETDKLLLFKKTQKLLDRFLFILFSEDRQLLPPNSIYEIIKQWKEQSGWGDEIQLYDRFKKYFHLLNVGWKGQKYEIYPYNGGLFFPDELLDKIKIDDEILQDHTLKLSQYDYETDIDVNILGHIFEHSLVEIENVQAEIKGEKVDLEKTKRKKEGIFYTPKYITKYIVENTVGKLCEEKKKELDIIDEEYAKGRKNRKKDTIKALDEKLNIYRNWLLSLTILDPACGSGAFLNQALEFLMQEHRKIDELRAQLFGGSIVFSDITSDILEKNIYGVDLNEESVEIAKLSLWLRTAQKGRKLNTLSNNIKCGNSLIDDPEIAGEKAFNWQNEFPEIFAKSGFDVIIGNPPYVRVQFLPYQEIDFYKENKVTAYKRIDISTLFFEEAYKLLKINGRLSFITSNQFQTTEYGQETRKFISQKYCIEKILDFGDLPVFEGALTYVSIYSLSKNSPKNFLYKRIQTIEEAQRGNYVNYIKISVSSINENKWSLVSSIELELLKKLEKFDTLGNYGNAWAGLFTGMDNILMFSYDEMKNSGIEEELFLPVIRASDPIRNGLALPSKYVIYPYKEEGEKTIVYSEEELKNKFPNGYRYLMENKEKLQSRQDSRKTFKDRKDWYALTRFGTKNIFKQTKIVSPGEVKEHKFSLDKSGSGFSCARVFAITINEKYPIKGLLALLNSSLLKFYLQRKSSLKSGGYYTYSSKVLNEVPMPKEISDEVISNAESLLQLNSDFNDINKNLMNLILSKYNIYSLSNKLYNWYNLETSDFLKELKRNNIELNLSEESVWIQYFNEQKQKASELKAKIDKIDKEIDQIVYKLYSLTNEEIKIVEESLNKKT